MRSDQTSIHIPGADASLLREYRFDEARFLAFQEAIASGSLTPASSLYRGRLDPPAAGDVGRIPPAGSAERTALIRRGDEAFSQGKVAVVVLAGGMATRFAGAAAPGQQVVKGTVDVLDGKSFLQFKLDDARAVGKRYGRPVPFCIMGSFATLPGKNGILAHLEQRGLAGDDVIPFAQSISLRLAPDGSVFGASPDGSPLPHDAYTTPGHGDFFPSIRDTGVLKLLREQGVEAVMFSNVDNLGATLDPALAGHFLALRDAGVAMLAETVERVPSDGAKVGVVVRADGMLRIVEGFRIPDHVDQRALTDASINTFTFALPALERDIPLDMHAVRKEVGGRPAIQGETVACEATGSVDAAGRPYLPFAAVRMPREGRPGHFFEGRFYPVKLPSDLDRVRGRLRLDRLTRAADALPGGATGEPVLLWSPGRINIIGEHTDYNEGFVLPAAVDLGIHLLGRRRTDREVVLQSLEMDGTLRFSLDQPSPAGDHEWSRYARGVFAALAEDGVAAPGMDVVLTSDLPSGSGMSSSTALCLGIAAAATALAGRPIDRDRLAHTAQRAEHIVGVQCGIMDQWAIAHGRAGHALLLDCRTLATEEVPLALGEFALVVFDTGKQRELGNSAYNERRAQCAQAARLLGKATLRDVTPDDLAGGKLPALLARRARHVVNENLRVQAAATALRNRDLATLGRLIDESHASLRDDFEVSCFELDTAVAVLHELGGEATLGARMMGGGFGGCALALIRHDALFELLPRAREAYGRATGCTPASWVVTAGDGLTLLANPTPRSDDGAVTPR
jgi:galactokinase